MKLALKGLHVSKKYTWWSFSKSEEQAPEHSMTTRVELSMTSHSFDCPTSINTIFKICIASKRSFITDLIVYLPNIPTQCCG